jgi:hypothetical protein
MLSLPLAKLSWAQDTDSDQQKFTWQQETHDLTFILDSYGARGATQLMKVVQGPQIRVCACTTDALPPKPSMHCREALANVNHSNASRSSD